METKWRTLLLLGNPSLGPDPCSLPGTVQAETIKKLLKGSYRRIASGQPFSAGSVHFFENFFLRVATRENKCRCSEKFVSAFSENYTFEDSYNFSARARGRSQPPRFSDFHRLILHRRGVCALQANSDPAGGLMPPHLPAGQDPAPAAAMEAPLPHVVTGEYYWRFSKHIDGKKKEKKTHLPLAECVFV